MKKNVKTAETTEKTGCMAYDRSWVSARKYQKTQGIFTERKIAEKKIEKTTTGNIIENNKQKYGKL